MRGTGLPFSTPARLIILPVGSLPALSPIFIPWKTGVFKTTLKTPTVRMISRAVFLDSFSSSVTFNLNVPMPRSFHSFPVKWYSFALHENNVDSPSSPVSTVVS